MTTSGDASCVLHSCGANFFLAAALPTAAEAARGCIVHIVRLEPDARSGHHRTVAAAGRRVRALPLSAGCGSSNLPGTRGGQLGGTDAAPTGAALAAWRRSRGVGGGVVYGPSCGGCVCVTVGIYTHFLSDRRSEPGVATRGPGAGGGKGTPAAAPALSGSWSGCHTLATRRCALGAPTTAAPV